MKAIASIKTVRPCAVTIYVDDLFAWVKMVTMMEISSRRKQIYKGKELLGPRWIYRGQADSSWNIKSSFERYILTETDDSPEQEGRLRDIENVAISHFCQWAQISRQEYPATKGEWLALMQHYLTPTRLVDFTEVPLIALAFAIEDRNHDDSDFAVWAALGNSRCYERYRILKKIKDRNESKVEICDNLGFRFDCDEWDRQEMGKILEGKCPGADDDCPGAPPHLLRYVPIGMNDRQKRQRGLFLASSHLSKRFMPLLHEWTNTDENDLRNPEIPLKKAMRGNKFIKQVANSRLIKYVFDKVLREEARALLWCSNITDLTRYGDLEKLSTEIKNIMRGEL